MKLIVESSHQVMKSAAAAGLMNALIAEKHGNSRRVSLEKILKLRPGIKNVTWKKSLNDCTSLRKTADKSVNRCQEPAIDARTHGANPNEEKSHCSISATTHASAVEVVQMSPKKALRVAMLTSRFADTIFKATHQTLIERDAARIAIEKSKTVIRIADFIDYFYQCSPNMLREMDILFGCYSNPKCLEKIGIYLKENYVEKDEAYEKEDDREEGEIF
ncbi:transcription factor GTE10-like [Salvia divinorum]|uniref:Transcription factor GTE10-like n=1 Tax=Salvia divinorum TaxID=28513 RepID=A0ABD1ICY1_SALDI